MNARALRLTIGLGLLLSAPLNAQTPGPVPATPVVTVTGSASVTLPNDRMHAWLRAEAENASASAAAADVNARVAKALARIKALPGVKATTSGYGTNQVVEKLKPTRWRVVQSVKVEGTDFIALAALVGKLQDEDAMLLSGMSFSLSDDARKSAEDSVTQTALKAWQQRAQNAAQGLGYAAWRAGRVTVQSNDAGQPYPMMRAQGMAMASSAAPVAVEAGTTDVTVTVSGEAVLDSPRAVAR